MEDPGFSVLEFLEVSQRCLPQNSLRLLVANEAGLRCGRHCLPFWRSFRLQYYLHSVFTTATVLACAEIHLRFL